jgi:hypothetical protein
MMLGRNVTVIMTKTKIPEYPPIGPLRYFAVLSRQTKQDASLHPAAASNSCMSRASKPLRNWTKHEKTGRNDLADLADTDYPRDQLSYPS